MLLCVAALAGAAGWWVAGNTVWTDSGGLRFSLEGSHFRQITWTAPKPVEGDGINTDDQEYEPSLSADGNELYFVRGLPGRSAHIYVCYRRENAWTPPIPLAAVNGPANDLGPRLTADNKYLLFYSDRPGGFGGYDIWAAPRASVGWGTPFNLGPGINTESNEYDPDPTPDGRHLIFATNRHAALREQSQKWNATIRQPNPADYDLWIAELADAAGDANPVTQPAVAPAVVAGAEPTTGPSLSLPESLRFTAAREIPGVNTPYVEGASCMSPFSDFLYFASDRPDGFGKFDLYRCRVTPEWEFGPVENLGSTVNSADNETDPAVAMGGYRLYFSSDRGGSKGGYDLYTSDSREVFPKHQSHPAPNLGVSGWIMLGSFLLLIPLFMSLRGWGDPRMTILQRSLLVSVLIHVLFSFAMSFVVVTQHVNQYVKQETGVDIGLALPKDLAVALSIRTDVTADAPSAVAPTDLSQTSAPLEPVELPAAPKPVQLADAGTTQRPQPTDLSVPRVAAHVDLNAEMAKAEALAPPLDAPQIRVDQPAPLQAEAPRVPEVAAPRALVSVPRPIDIGPAAPIQVSPVPVVAPQASVQPSAEPVPLTLPLRTDSIASAQPNDAPAPSTLLAKPAFAPMRRPGDVRVVGETPAGLPDGDAPAALSASVLPQPVAQRVGPAASIGPEASIPVTSRGQTSGVALPDDTGYHGVLGSTDSVRPAEMALAPAPLAGAISAPRVVAPAAPRVTGAGGAGSATQPAGVLAPGDSGVPSVGRSPLAMASGGAKPIDLGVTPAVAPQARPVGTGVGAGALAGPSAPGSGKPSKGGAPLTGIEDVPMPAIGPRPADAHAAGPTIREPFVQRTPERRKPLVEKMGGTRESEAAVDRALAYLARQQEPDGRWTFVNDEGMPGRRRKAPHDMAYTGLSILAFLARDHAPDRDGPYRDVVQRGVAYLLDHQERDGDLRGPADQRGGGSGRANMYDHAIATLALAENALMTQDPRCTEAVFSAARFIVAAQHRPTGGWRYIPGEVGDTSVFGWEVMALHSAEMLGFQTPPATRSGELKFVSLVSGGSRKMLAAYQPGGVVSPSMTAEMLFCRMLLGQPLSDADVEEASNYLVREPPDLASPDLYYWYYASLSMMQAQSKAWQGWNAATRDGLIRLQHREGNSEGCWKRNAKRVDYSGYIFNTAIATLTLEVYYRYGPMLEASRVDEQSLTGSGRLRTDLSGRAPR